MSEQAKPPVVTLDHPTVAQLIEALSKFDPNAKCRLLDADTSYYVFRFEVAMYGDGVVVVGTDDYANISAT